MKKTIIIIACLDVVIICAILAILKLFILNQNSLSSNNGYDAVEIYEDISSFIDDSNENNSKTESYTKSSKSDNYDGSSKTVTSNNFDVQAEKIVTDSQIEEPNIDISVKNVIYSGHSSLSKEDYYQYSTLTKNEKTFYNRIVDTVLASNSVVKVSDISVEYDEAVSVIQKVMADYPQFFYISRNCILTYSRNKKTVNTVVLLYTDGNSTDEYNDNMKIIKTADRDSINKQISTLQSKIESIIKKIPDNTASIYKEKAIHDYITENVIYDQDAAENVGNYNMTIPHSFDIYGAAVNNKAVCEGYSKLFQYLCYCVGINSTQITGTSYGGNHMWNAVLIENEWYQIDVTWADTDSIINYCYFNLTGDKMSNNHSADTSKTSVPTCNSTKYSFINTFAVTVSDLNQAPVDYESTVLNIKTANDKYIYFYIKELENSTEDTIDTKKYTVYFQTYITNKRSSFYYYALKQGLRLSTEMNRLNEFIIIKLE